jgi:hypothetical protein
LFSKIFIAAAERFLRTHHHTTKAKGDHAVSFIDFHLPPTTQILELRKAIWQGIFALYSIPALQAEVLKLLKSHRSFDYHSCDKQIIEQDAAEVLPFFESQLNRDSYSDCVLVQDYLATLSRRKVAVDESLQRIFRNETYKLAEVLFDDWAERSDLGWEQYQEQKGKQIKEFFADYTREDYEHFFSHCVEIWNAQDHGREIYQFHSRVLEALLKLASDKPDLFVQVLEGYSKQSDPLNLADYYPSVNLMAKLIEICGDAQTYQLLAQPEHNLRRKWLSFFFISLPSENITTERASQLYSLYQTGELGELPQGLDFLARYQAVDESVFLKVTTILVEKAEQGFRYGFYLADLFNEHAETSTRVRELFAQNVDLLKRAYFYSLRHDRFPDYRGAGFNAILDLNKNFVGEYIEWMYSNWGQHEQLTLSRYDDQRNYDFLWLRIDWAEVMSLLVWKIFEMEKERFSLCSSYIEVFFIKRAGDQVGNDIRDRQEQFISEQIILHSENSKFMSLIFRVVANFPYDRRHTFIRLFIEHNGRFEDFAELSLEQEAFSWSGSAVPVLQKKAEYFESLLELFNSARFLRHKQYVEQRIQGLRNWIEDEKKRDFARD